VRDKERSYLLQLQTHMVSWIEKFDALMSAGKEGEAISQVDAMRELISDSTRTKATFSAETIDKLEPLWDTVEALREAATTHNADKANEATRAVLKAVEPFWP